MEMTMSTQKTKKSQATKAKSQLVSTPIIPDEISNEYLRIRREVGIVEAKVFYFKMIMPLLRPWLEKRKEHQPLRKQHYSTLVSLMGYSPETTVHSTVVLRPAKLVVVYNDLVAPSAEPALDYLKAEGIISHFNLTLIEVDAFDPVDIYERILAQMPSSDHMIFDITGGTKIMSATAGALAWEKGLSLCYLNGNWDPQKGAAGLQQATELVVYTNPSRSRGYRYRQEALRNYERGNFISAREGFRESVKLISESDFDQLGVSLCDCYCALVDFDRVSLINKIEKLEETLAIGGVRRLYEHHIQFDSHLNALRAFAEDPINLMATSAAFTILARSYAKQGRFDLAGLLSYRSMERFVEMGLQAVAPRFKLDKPDWALLTTDVSQLRIDYANLTGNKQAVLPEKVTLVAGMFVLAVLDSDLGQRFRGTTNHIAAFTLSKLATMRNRSYLAHGVNNLTEADYLHLSEGAMDLAKAILKDQHAEFEVLCSQLRPVALRQLWSEGRAD